VAAIKASEGEIPPPPAHDPLHQVNRLSPWIPGRQFTKKKGRAPARPDFVSVIETLLKPGTSPLNGRYHAQSRMFCHVPKYWDSRQVAGNFPFRTVPISTLAISMDCHMMI
jgi:hypothetical protein